MTKYLKLSVIILLGAFVACSGNSDNNGNNNSNGNNGGSSSNIGGRWYVEVSFSGSGSAYPYVADIQQTDTSFTGTITWGTKYAKNFNGVITGNSLKFASADDSLHFTGTIVSSDSIAGLWYNKFTGDSGSWFAIKPFTDYNMEGTFSGNFYLVNGYQVDTIEIHNGLWKGKALTTTNGDTTFFAGEMFAVADSDTVSSDVSMGGLIYGDSVFVDFGCTVSGKNGRFDFVGVVNGDSASGRWVVSPISGGYSFGGDGTFNGYVGNVLK